MGTDNANKDRQAIDLLFAERCSCVVRNGDTIRIFRERGVRDLWRLLHEEPELLEARSWPTRWSERALRR